MTPTPTLEEILQRHLEFWEISAARPLVGRIIGRKWEPKPYPLKGGVEVTDPQVIQARQMDIERLLGTHDREFEPFTGEMINLIGPCYPTSWLEALIGCPISVSAFGCVALPVQLELSRAVSELSVETALSSPWMSIMDEVLLRAGEFARGRAPVAQLHLRGVVDLLAAYLGEERLCLAIYDAPDQIRILAETLTSLVITVARRGLKLRRKWRNGYVSCWSLFAPEVLVDYQIDASIHFSPSQYRDMFLEYDRKVLRAFPLSVMHLHSGALHMLDVVLELKDLSVVEISIDREAGDWDMLKLVHSSKKVQAAGKRLLLVGWLEESEFAEIVNALRPQGLAISYWSYNS
jgi:hypothetical protein